MAAWEAGVRWSDSHLVAMSGVSGRLSAGQRPARPGAGSPRRPVSRSRLQQAAAWSVAALITLAAAISVLLSKTVAGATASVTPARATAKPSQHHPGPQPRRASPWAHAHRVMTAHAVEVAARAPARQGGITISSSFLRQLLVVRRLLRGEYVAAARRDWQLQRYQALSALTWARPQDRPRPDRTTPRCAGPASLRSSPSHSCH